MGRVELTLTGHIPSKYLITTMFLGRSPKPAPQSWKGSDVWKSEIENYTPFDKADAKTYYVRGPYIEHPSLTNGDNTTNENGIATPQASIAPYTGPRTILVNCPGGKIPVRTSASVKADVVRYIGAGDKIIIYPKPVAGFFQLVDDAV